MCIFKKETEAQKRKSIVLVLMKNTDIYFSLCINTCCKQENRHKMESLMLSVTKGDLTTVLAPSKMES